MNHLQWCCENGCGECGVVTSMFEYERVEDLQGNLILSKQELVLASSCCKAGLMLWDDQAKDFVSEDTQEAAEKSLLQQCIDSGQVSAAQLVQHRAAGEI